MSVPVTNNKRKEWREEGERARREKKQFDLWKKFYTIYFNSVSYVKKTKIKINK